MSDTDATEPSPIDRIRAQAAGLDLIAAWLEVNAPRLAKSSPHSPPEFAHHFEPAVPQHIAEVSWYVPGRDQWEEAVRILAESDPEAVEISARGPVDPEAGAVGAVRMFGAARFTVWIMAGEYPRGLGPIYPTLDEILCADDAPLTVLPTSLVDAEHAPLAPFGGDAA